MTRKSIPITFWILLGLSAFDDVRLEAQNFRRLGTEFNAMRTVNVAEGKPYTIVVTEFFHHGEIRPDGKNVVVVARNELVPMRILQRGEDDLCRLAFQTVPGQLVYEIYYGGDPPTQEPPPWTCRDGLLLETRKFSKCNFSSHESVRQAFQKAAPIGADYVEGVFHACNPFTLKNEPFLTRYSGVMDIRKPGVYGFILSSQDCSFLLIDDKLAAAAPGHHGPAYRALPGSRHDVTLSAGLHPFEFYHAAGGPRAMMAVAVEIDPGSDNPLNPTVLPPEIFHTHLVAHLPATQLTLRSNRAVPDFLAKIVNEVPLPDNDEPLIGVMFRSVMPRAMTMQGAKLQWDFGDGQTSQLPNVDHVYLRPGLYTIKLSVRRGSKTLETANRVLVDVPRLTQQNPSNSFDDYLKIIQDYDPRKLDAPSLRQLVLAYQAKAWALWNQAEDMAAQAQTAGEDPNLKPNAQRDVFATINGHRDHYLSQGNEWQAKAVEVGKVAFIGESAAKGDADLLKLAQWIAPVARDQLGDSETAFAIWQGAAERIASPELKAECEIAAADIALNDLVNPSEAQKLLDAAEKRLDANATGPIAGRLHRVRGDSFAAAGNGSAAQDAYFQAEQLAGLSKSFAQNTAILGAHARSTEAFIQQKQFSRAAEELQAWQRNFPSQKVDGYWTFFAARYWAGRGKYEQAIAQVEQLQAVNPNSPYVDQALLLAADSEMRLGRKDRAIATLHSLVDDYPGSPLVPLAKKNLDVLEKRGEGSQERGEGK